MWPLGLDVISDVTFTSMAVTGLNKAGYIRRSAGITKGELKGHYRERCDTGRRGDERSSDLSETELARCHSLHAPHNFPLHRMVS